MKYTYEIKFGAASYITLTPNTEVIMEGYWESGTMIWRERISELKIIDTVYATLESWFEDDTKFETQILVKILKDSVEDSIHWFGVKWGTLNKELQSYVVEPIPHDLWAQYFEHTKDIKYTGGVAGQDWLVTFYNTTGTYPYINTTTLDAFIETLKTFASEKTTWPSSDVVSSFLNADAYEDSSAVGTYRGMSKDYVTGKESYLHRGGFDTLKGYSFADILEYLTLLRVLVFFDSNDKLRFEHIKFFNDKLIDNAVDFSSYIKDYDEEWSYVNPEIAVLEKLKMSNEEDDTDDDFLEIDVTYSNIRNRPDAEIVEFVSVLKSNLKNLGAPDVFDDLVLHSGLSNHVYKFFDSTMTAFSSDGNTFDITYGVGEICWSQDFFVEGDNHDFTFTAEITSISGSFAVEIYSRSPAGLSNSITVNSTGTTSGTLSISPSGDYNDGYLRIIGLSGGSAVGYITLVEATDTQNTITPTIDGVISDSPQTNGAMSMANIFAKWWQDDRLSREADMGGDSYVFNGTKYNLKRKTIKIHYSAVINPLYGFDDGRVGRIESWKRSLDTDYYEINVIYQEDE